MDIIKLLKKMESFVPVECDCYIRLTGDYMELNWRYMIRTMSHGHAFTVRHEDELDIILSHAERVISKYIESIKGSK